ncbi:MAG: AmmeMemoRadiSam system protein A [Verrucomicrobia bacterium]|nr:MAG: AmmeMemoRadiSam system protein A [Verrucomicrobiota bacterium]
MMPPRLSPDERSLLLELARETIATRLREGRMPAVGGDYLPPRLAEPAACFVTLTKDGALRGCMGTLEPRWPLYRAVMENAAKAAFGDPRFPPVTLEELPELHIEISVLSPVRVLPARTPEEKLAALEPGRHGVILRARGLTATYLPQVWEKLPDKELFLASLSRKAGLDPAAWRSPEAILAVYEVESFEEPEPGGLV